MKRNLLKWLHATALIALSGSMMCSTAVWADGYMGWKEENGKKYWYENDVKQGTYEDAQGVLGDGTIRGREIYDPESDGWYWLDAVYGGAKAVNKEVWMPYIYQNEDDWSEGELTANASASGDMAQQVINEIKNKNGKWVRYDANGKMYKGWYTVEGAEAELYPEQAGNTYYYDQKTGLMAKGSVQIDGKTYYFDEVTGVLQTDSTENDTSTESTEKPSTENNDASTESTEKPSTENTEQKPNETFGLGVTLHTREEVRNYMSNSGASVENKTEYDISADFSAPYEPGTLKEDSLKSALAMLNEIRYIAGLDCNVGTNDTYNQMAQAGAFTNAVNGELSHYPSKPEGMSDELYELAREGASSSNIAYTSWGTSLSYACWMWMDDSDSYNIDRLGHRRWMLNPTMQETGFGYARNGNGPVYTAIYAFDGVFEETDVYGVAWPAQEMPMEYFANDIAWSYSYGQALSDVKVQLDCQTAGKEKTWYFAESGSNGYFNVNNDNYGLKGCVVFRPDDIEIENGDSYLVTIWQGETVIAKYTVNFFE